MPPKSGSALFMGLELAVDQLRACLVDESLDLVHVESVDFDTEVSGYQTQGGIFTTPGDAYTTPVEMWVKGLDVLLTKLSRALDVSRIKAIGGASQHALVWWKSTPVPSLASLDPGQPLHIHFNASSFSLPNAPVAQDTSAQPHALEIERLMGGPERMALRVGSPAHSSLIASQMLRVRETWPQEVWARTGRVQLAATFLGSLICGKWMSICEADACATGMWIHGANPIAVGGQGSWDETVLNIVGGSPEEGRRAHGWLGEVDTSGGGRPVGYVSRYLVERFGFDPAAIVTSFMSEYMASYLSLCLSPSDLFISFGPMDVMMTAAQNFIPSHFYHMFPHPAQEPGEKRKYVAVLTCRNGDVPRALVRDMYTKSWSAFDRLVAIVPPGGSIGLDDKLFSFWQLQGDDHPQNHVKGIYRFETGIKVTEFRDLRANPRCLIESQMLSLRVRWAQILSTGVLGPKKSAVGPTPPPSSPKPAVSPSLGISFDPYDHTVLPNRIIATGAAANFPSVSNLLGDVFNAPVYVPATQVDSAQIVPHRNTPVQGFPSRASLGVAYHCRWVWGRQNQHSGSGAMGYEEEMKRLLGKRWVVSGNTPLKTNIGGLLSKNPGATSGSASGASTPFGTISRGSGLGNTVFVEEEEEEVGDLAGSRRFATPAVTPSQPPLVRVRTQTASTADTMSSSSTLAPSTAFTTPDMSALSPTTPTGTAPTPLTPVTALPTGDAEAQVGLCKVAEPDLDAFMCYAAIVPEFCRLESLLVQGLV
ncbi:actin-like ATPase domain-containing protein [Fistulina hepatica ATCC 64428]|uniref:Actin-like ATPase domain-containing protein n=1 Tax=Fistulina hepatica ATCC 64428 TaxID=1128425 RepID=A0A0D7AET9_9AGAR|nr:actin-like ATPase domain-containing protein [Fistulina hepatica ATCC 64428]